MFRLGNTESPVVSKSNLTDSVRSQVARVHALRPGGAPAEITLGPFPLQTARNPTDRGRQAPCTGKGRELPLAIKVLVGVLLGLLLAEIIGWYLPVMVWDVGPVVSP